MIQNFYHSIYQVIIVVVIIFVIIVYFKHFNLHKTTERNCLVAKHSTVGLVITSWWLAGIEQFETGFKCRSTAFHTRFTCQRLLKPKFKLAV